MGKTRRALKSNPKRRCHVNFGFTDMPSPGRHVCSPMKAAIIGRGLDVRYGPTGDMVEALAHECHRLNVRSGKYSLIATANPPIFRKAKEDHMKFRPLHDRVVVKRIDAEDKTAG